MIRGLSGVHQNLVYIKNENLVYISKGIWCSQEKVLVLFQDSENFYVHRRWIWSTPEKPLLHYLVCLICIIRHNRRRKKSKTIMIFSQYKKVTQKSCLISQFSYLILQLCCQPLDFKMVLQGDFFLFYNFDIVSKGTKNT